MKTATIVLLSLAFVVPASAQTYSNTSNSSTSAPLRAQTPSPAVGHDITGFTSKTASAVNPESVRTQPNPNIRLTPRLGGVFIDGAKYGTVMISPAAPLTYGMGEKYLSAPSSRYDLERQSGAAAHHDAGGIKLFSLEF